MDDLTEAAAEALRQFPAVSECIPKGVTSAELRNFLQAWGIEEGHGKASRVLASGWVAWEFCGLGVWLREHVDGEACDAETRTVSWRRRLGKVWGLVATIELPRSVKFEDYSALAIRGERIAVASQQTSRLWLGRLRRRDWTIVGAGQQYDFPRTRKGRRLYSTVEGISWLPDDTFVAVSDLTKAGHPGRCAAKDQSIHIFRLPCSGSE